MIRDMRSFLLGLIHGSTITASLIALGLLLFADCADGRTREHRAVDAALRHWNRAPACGRPSVQWRNPPASLADPWPPAAWQPPNECVVAIRGDYHGPYIHFCALVAHEIGHLLGRDHSRRGLMSPWLTPPPSCTTRRARSKPPHTRPSPERPQASQRRSGSARLPGATPTHHHQGAP